jgi:hypothetical protein
MNCSRAGQSSGHDRSVTRTPGRGRQSPLRTLTCSDAEQKPGSDPSAALWPPTCAATFVARSARPDGPSASDAGTSVADRVVSPAASAQVAA